MPLAIWTGIITVVLIGLYLLWLGLKAQKRPAQTGDSSMIGETGIVRRTAGFRNRLVVEVRGEYWWSKTEGSVTLSKGSEIVVVGVDKDDLILVVKPLERG